MVGKKRLMLASRRGSSEIMNENMLLLFEIVIVVFVFAVLASFVNDIRNSTLFDKNYLVRDTALLIETVYASPQRLSYNYTENVSEYVLSFDQNKARTREQEQANPVDKIYWYADENDSRLHAGDSYAKMRLLVFTKDADGVSIRGESP